ncbi:interleukin-13 [Sorex fumeus]|uniref:interleukin-13 n=1 Tax=Sorex fumeus TaxID=62283 RepID=UPI0024AD0AA5|nr:interleukin-13 [Sorex fumeus]
MAHWLTVVIALTCLGGLTSPSPVPQLSNTYKELIRELMNITDSHKAALCNGSMVWSINLTHGSEYCAALQSLNNVSNCSALSKTRHLLLGLCPLRIKAGQISRILTRDTKIEVIQFARHLLTHFRKMYKSIWAAQTRA